MACALVVRMRASARAPGAGSAAALPGGTSSCLGRFFKWSGSENIVQGPFNGKNAGVNIPRRRGHMYPVPIVVFVLVAKAQFVSMPFELRRELRKLDIELGV